MIGQSIAHYQITEKIGAGGMGEVYRARDTKLNREVALKVLPAAFARDSQRMARFAREAQVLASLNHPNIAAIYGLEEWEGQHALVLELVEGQTLAERIRKGAIPLEEVLGLALQMAEALEAAHEKGVIHRDLKPANVKITPEGTVKVLDFGLAKAMEGDLIASPDLSHSPTLSMPRTRTGVILGTAAYMSPEQAEGKAVDRRADIWAFGAVLYEMLTGTRVFRQNDVPHTLAAVLRDDPDWGRLPRKTSPAIRRLLKRCLERDLRQRLQAIAEARIAIEGDLSDPGGQEGVTAAAGPGRRKRLWLAGAGLALAALGFLVARTFKPVPSIQPLEIEATLAADEPLLAVHGSALALSPDGSLLAYATDPSGPGPPGPLHLRSTHRLESRTVSGTEGGYNPFFSPDGQWLGFVTQTELKKVGISGGAPLKLCGVTSNQGAAWGPRGQIVFVPHPASGLMRVSTAGGEPEPVTQLGEGEKSHRWPQFLPGGRRVLYTAYTSTDLNQGDIKVVDLETQESQLVHRGGSYARYTVSGHLLYWQKGTLFAAPFDLETVQMTGQPRPVLEGVAGNMEGGAQYDVARDGTLVYLAGAAGDGAEVQRTLVSVGRNGQASPLSGVKGNYAFAVKLSPDEKRLAVTRDNEGNLDIWIVDLEQDSPTRLTFDEGLDLVPTWSPDGRSVYFSSQRHGQWQIYRKAADGSSEAERLLEGEHEQVPHSISPDGKTLLYAQLDPKTQSDLWILPLEKNSKPKPFLVTRFVENSGRFSPDGRWIAYQSDESGRFEVYVRPYPAAAGKWQVSSGGGAQPRWSAEGRRLFFSRGNQILEAAVAVQGNSLRVGRPHKVVNLRGRYVSYLGGVLFDVTSDDNRFVLIQNPAGGGNSTSRGTNLVRFTFHWFAALRQRLEAKQ